MIKRLVLVLLFLLFPCGGRVVFGQGEAINADAIRRESSKARTYFYGKELEYRIDVHTFHGPKGASFFTTYPDVVQKGTRKLAIGCPVPKRTYIPSRVMHFQKNQGEPHLDDDPLLTYFQGFDGRYTNTYVRKLLYLTENRSVTESFGDQQVGCSIAAFRADPMVRMLVNQMEPFLGLPGQNLAFVEMKDRVKAERVEHPADKNAVRISSTDPNSGQYFIISSPPEYLILENSRKTPDTPLVTEIVELATFDGFRYPSRATYRELESGGKHGWSATVELIDVRSIDVAKTEWNPPWPEGTEWLREQDLKRFQVPYSRDQMRKIQAAGLARARSYNSEASTSFFNLNLALLIAIIVLLVYRYWPREKNSV